MASKTEGIALLSMYNDEDEEEEEEQQNIEVRIDEESNDLPQNIVSDPVQDQIPSKSPQNLSSPSPEIRSLRSPTPPPWPKSHRSSPMILTSPSPGLPPRLPSERVAIVDYAHDEAAMSPEAEEGEIMSSGRVVVSMEIQAWDGSLEERTPPGTVQLLTPSIQAEPPQPSDVPEQSRAESSMAIDSTGMDLEIAQTEIAIIVSEEVQEDDRLKKFLPPRVTTMCPDELQIKINKFLAYKKSGKSFNAALRNRKDYRNPDFLQHAVRYQDIDQIGTCFDKDVFDPHGYDKSDYFDEIEANMKREMERKEQERKKSQKVDFVPGGAHPGTVAPALKIGAQIPGISAPVTSGSQSVSAAADSSKEIRQNKKTKWDKIDGDIKNPMISSGNDNLSSVGVHAAHLSAANAGTGYTAFAQQKRREAEEQRSDESKSKFDKRS